MTAPGRRGLLWRGVGAVALVVAVAGGVYFQPWRLFTKTSVADALPPAATASAAAASEAPSAPVTASPTPTPTPAPTYRDLAAGTFVSHEHETSGTVRIVEQPDGSRVLAIQGLMTSDGPDLRVWLTDQPVIDGADGWYVFDDGRYIELGALKGNLGDQVYDIPPDLDLTGLSSVTIWCARFAVSFGAAALGPA